MPKKHKKKKPLKTSLVCGHINLVRGTHQYYLLDFQILLCSVYWFTTVQKKNRFTKVVLKNCIEKFESFEYWMNKWEKIYMTNIINENVQSYQVNSVSTCTHINPFGILYAFEIVVLIFGFFSHWLTLYVLNKKKHITIL